MTNNCLRRVCGRLIVDHIHYLNYLLLSLVDLFDVGDFDSILFSIIQSL